MNYDNENLIKDLREECNRLLNYSRKLERYIILENEMTYDELKKEIEKKIYE